MTEPEFTVDGRRVASVTADEMREVDRVATDEVGLALLSMMENAGRTLAATVRADATGHTTTDEPISDTADETIDDSVHEPITIACGAGGNGGGGFVAARHLANAGRPVRVVLDRPAEQYDGVPARQLRVLRATDARIEHVPPTELTPRGTFVDALVGYGLREAARGRVAALIDRADAFDRVVSLDVPSGLDATTGDRPGPAVRPDATLTLALPKAGLAAVDGDLSLADIGIPAGVYDRAGVAYDDPFDGRDRVPLTVA